MLAAGALRPEGADDARPDLADELDDVGRNSLRRRACETTIGPFEQPGMSEADDADGFTPLFGAFGRELGLRPGSALFSEPQTHVAAGEREESRRMTGGRELHRRAGDAERFVVRMCVHEQRGADRVTLA